MQWQMEYDQLSNHDKEHFTRVVSRLFDETFLLRDVWDGKEGRLVGNRDFRFVERVRPLLERYLEVSGWALQVDSLRGVIALYNQLGRNRRQLDKLTTYLLFILRLTYDEQMEEVSMRREIIIPLRDVYEKLHTLGFVEKRLAQHRLRSALQLLRKISVIDRVEGDDIQPQSRWIVYPSIRLLVPEDHINQLYEQVDASGDSEGQDEGGVNFHHDGAASDPGDEDDVNVTDADVDAVESLDKDFNREYDRED